MFASSAVFLFKEDRKKPDSVLDRAKQGIIDDITAATLQNRHLFKLSALKFVITSNCFVLCSTDTSQISPGELRGTGSHLSYVDICGDELENPTHIILELFDSRRYRNSGFAFWRTEERIILNKQIDTDFYENVEYATHFVFFLFCSIYKKHIQASITWIDTRFCHILATQEPAVNIFGSYSIDNFTQETIDTLRKAMLTEKVKAARREISSNSNHVTYFDSEVPELPSGQCGIGAALLVTHDWSLTSESLLGTSRTNPRTTNRIKIFSQKFKENEAFMKNPLYKAFEIYLIYVFNVLQGVNHLSLDGYLQMEFITPANIDVKKVLNKFFYDAERECFLIKKQGKQTHLNIKFISKRMPPRKQIDIMF